MSVVLEAKNKGGVPLSVILLEIFPAALAVFLLATVGVMHVTSRVLVVRMGYELSKLDSRSSELTRENDALRLELSSLTAPQRLAPVAKEQLGMQVPSVVIPVK
jgi:cell division protein FtsL